MAGFCSQPTHWIRPRVDLLLGLRSDMDFCFRIRTQPEPTAELCVCVGVRVCTHIVYMCLRKS